MKRSAVSWLGGVTRNKKDDLNFIERGKDMENDHGEKLNTDGKAFNQSA